MEKKPYKKTEKIWLGLVILFYVLYNLPGVPAYGDSKGAIIHGLLTIVPLWIVVYWGLFKLNNQRKLRDVHDPVLTEKDDVSGKGGRS